MSTLNVAERPAWAVVSERDAAGLLGLSQSHLRRLRYAGQAPHHVHLGERRIGYRLADLRIWLDARTAA